MARNRASLFSDESFDRLRSTISTTKLPYFLSLHYVPGH